MTHPTAVILIVGLNRSLIGRDCPRLAGFASRGVVRRLKPVLPAVTCPVQSSMLTGRTPGGDEGHGIVANGYYDRQLAQVFFWRQSNHIVRGPKVWETAKRRDPAFTCANLFWWFNMYGGVDYSVTPRPIYKADGSKIPDLYTRPAPLRDQLQDRFGRFPLFKFWGPGASIASSWWIAQASEYVHRTHDPSLMLVYLPHLDYPLQKLGPGHPDIPKHVNQIDRVVGRLLDYFADRGVRVMILSEYGIEPVDRAVPINRLLREQGLLRVREEQGLDVLDPGASGAFAVADHQVAHVYLKDPGDTDRVKAFVSGVPGVERVLDRRDQAGLCLDHPRGGDLLLVSAPERWFSYGYWLDEARAPDFARTVDIHRKPGYDPLELFIDPALRFPRWTIAAKLLRRKLGMRALLDVIPLNTDLVRGSHGRIEQADAFAPVLITQGPSDDDQPVSCCQVHRVILEHLFGPDGT